MKWVIAVLLVLGFSFVIGSDLLAYAMYSLLTLMAASLWLSKNWAAQLSATRECSQLKAEIDDHVGIELEVTNRGSKARLLYCTGRITTVNTSTLTFIVQATLGSRRLLVVDHAAVHVPGRSTDRDPFRSLAAASSSLFRIYERGV